jgi:spore cortex formation protein SpoVR/YcgB (stage V sporulation)
MGITLKQLQTAAKELNSLDDFLEEKIDTKQDEETLTQLIVEAVELIEEDDVFEFTKGTQSVLDALSAPAPVATKAEPAKKGTKKVEPIEEIEEEPETEEEITEEAPEETEGESELVTEIRSTKKVKELLEIVAEEKIFKPSAKKLNAIKNVDTLRDAMLAILLPAAEVKKPIAKDVPAKKEPVAPAKKEAVTKVPVEKKEPVKKVKKEKAPNRQDSVVKAINELCKKGATLKEVMNASDKLYVAQGGESNPTATNVNSYTMNALLAFDVLEKDAKGYYKFKK